MTATETQTPATTRTCPPSAVVDMIVPYGDVRAGDLTLHDDQLIVAENVNAYTDTWQGHEWPRVDITYLGENGMRFTFEAHADRYTAVRRYTEGISERDALVVAALDEAAADRDKRARFARHEGRTDEEREHRDMASQYRVERDRREAGRD